MAESRQKAMDRAEGQQRGAPDPFPPIPTDAHLPEHPVTEGRVGRAEAQGQPADVEPIHPEDGHKGQAQDGRAGGEVHIGMTAELHGLKILRHTVHIQPPMEQGVRQVAIVVIEDKFMVVEHEQDKEAGREQKQLHRPLPPGPECFRRCPTDPSPIQAKEGDKKQRQGAHSAEIPIVRCHFAVPPFASCRIVHFCHCTPRIALCQRAGGVRPKNAHFAGFPARCPLAPIYPQPGPENYPHYPPSYPPSTEFPAFWLWIRPWKRHAKGCRRSHGQRTVAAAFRGS